MDKKFTLETLNLLKNKVLENDHIFGKELTEILIDVIDGIIYVFNEIFEEISKTNLDNINLRNLWFIYSEISPLYEDINKISSEIDDILNLSSKDINNWKLWKNLGDKAYLCKAYYEALFCYNKALEINSEDLEVLCKKGYTLLRISLNEINLSIKYFEKVLEKDENNYKALFGLGEAYYNLNNEENAIKYFEKILKLNPNDVEALEYLGDIYYEKDYEKAINYYKKALELKPKDVNLILKIAHSYVELKKYEDALKYFEKALSLNPDVFELEQIYEFMGRIYIYLGEDEKAMEYFEKLKEINPYHDEIYEVIALTYGEVGNVEKAEKYLRKLELTK
ncbi:tetratricopeptide repeat protein [Methanotorris igneus]|uniref:Tetratricopeptide TPR_2 repeat-containing protein n=1 Tax=Methanotorris igneus (strain DSM 5666 / JCM 11834 / Kol 5) TaxID=880724 RepID=F6BDQ0_METIK|nr:tetratricopeptide repeat protein [Methanotorris igneus]AEF96611.1 Tetratricopeptide TPR_2 repeat-containing protein [Methanotorris igneus Kol 5]